MSSDAKKLQPIIVKKIKKGGHAAHGGAWKIAYADFVTAMMAFFLLMWLLGSTTKGDLKGLSDYFNSPLKVALSGGPGSGASDSILPGGGADLTRKSGQAQRAAGDDRNRRRQVDLLRAQAAQEDARKLAALSAKISAVISNNPRLSEYSQQIRLRITPDGLQIQIVDDQKRPMFDSGSAVVQPYMREILREIGSALNTVDNKISLDGHTDSAPYSLGERGYSNWELSADRANASRRELVFAGMPDDKLARVVGMGSAIPLEPADPLSPANRRITILVMTREAEERLLGVSRLPQESDVPEPAPQATDAAPAPARAPEPAPPIQ